MKEVTFEQWQTAAFDTEVYWAKTQLPRYAEHFQDLQREDPKLAKTIEPYLEHLLAWDARITVDSTAAPLCHAWYEQLYGAGYPGEKIREQFAGKPQKQLAALAKAAQRLQAMHGDWRIPYGELYRSQRKERLADLLKVRFDPSAPSLPSVGGHGPMGTILTQYYTPSLEIPFVISQPCRYGLVGTSYLAAYEFTASGVRGASLVPFGTSGDPSSPHYFDQARLLADQRMKPELFRKAAVVQNAVESYHPGERAKSD